MTKPFMRPASGEGAYTPDDDEAKLAYDALNTYIRARIRANRPLLIPDSVSPGQVDNTLSMFLDDYDVGVIAEPADGSNIYRWAFLMSPPLLSRYICVEDDKRIHRVQQNLEVAADLDAASSATRDDPSGHASRNAAIEEAIERGIFPRIIVGQEEVNGLIAYLETGEPFIPRR